MPDPFSGAVGTTKQEVDILGKVNERKKARSFGSNKKDKEEKKAPVRVSELYNAGVALLKSRGFTVELHEGGYRVVEVSRVYSRAGRRRRPHQPQDSQTVASTYGEGYQVSARF